MYFPRRDRGERLSTICNHDRDNDEGKGMAYVLISLVRMEYLFIMTHYKQVEPYISFVFDLVN